MGTDRFGSREDELREFKGISKALRYSLIFWVIVFSLLALNAKAETSLELGLGVSHGQLVGDKLWYDSRFPYSKKLTSLAGTLGVHWHETGNVFAYRVGYADLGNIAEINAIGLSDDGRAADTHQSRFASVGRVRGFYATAAPGVSIGSARVEIEGGLFIYKPDFEVCMYDMPHIYYEDNTFDYTENACKKHHAPIMASYLVGLRVEHKSVSLSVRAFPSLGSRQTDDYLPSYKSAFLVTLEVRN